ncbi:hypothetical protein K493DRAFT_20635 [Basidiobolus meristosporus CBS 931.73]|uniref:Efficient mitochondria targeting-associated protein 19 n=1 Tax=Basidiobolus meristosporus CBS 931.73 TaxID=1314790 RepID=A0A1Y1YE45_9FUNG|nr:hypothetical protein K493DRAFT_20635 [Basidiobolus meristosporus CBS 931.73]|eukprot:ORX96193.1 hypothetical protein K493DRAFT_20635 [Basidiobolus meristosporus CBS 931.73]
MAGKVVKPTFKESTLDTLFVGYFVSHIIFTIFLDVQCIFPLEWFPKPAVELLGQVILIIKDPFLATTVGYPEVAPAKIPNMVWFQSMVWFEAFVQLPFFFWYLYAYFTRNINIRIPAIIYGSHVATTLIPILAELFFNPYFEQTQEQRLMTAAIYLPYFVIPLLLVYRYAVGFHLVNGTKKKQ